LIAGILPALLDLCCKFAFKIAFTNVET